MKRPRQVMVMMGKQMPQKQPVMLIRGLALSFSRAGFFIFMFRDGGSRGSLFFSEGSASSGNLYSIVSVNGY